MKNISALGMSSALAALLVFAAPAHAQQQDITEEEVRSYLEQLQEEVMEVVRSEEFHRVDELTERHIAEGAVFTVIGQMMKDDEPKSFMATTLEREDLLAMKHRAVGTMHGIDVEDYTLNVEVGEVRTHGSGAATVQATWTDRGAVSVAAEAAAREGQTTRQQTGQTQPSQQLQPGQQVQPRQQVQPGQQQEQGRLTFERTLECHHVVQREGEDLKIGLTTCRAEARL